MGRYVALHPFCMRPPFNDCRRYLSEAAYEHVPDALTVLRLLQHRQSPMVDTDWQTFGLPGQVPQWQVEFVNLIVRAHRRTGRQGLFISTGALRHTGITEADGHALPPFLQAHASSPNYTVSFGWHPGDFVLWDNLATWHYAVNDYDGPGSTAR